MKGENEQKLNENEWFRSRKDEKKVTRDEILSFKEKNVIKCYFYMKSNMQNSLFMGVDRNGISEKGFFYSLLTGK